MFFRSLGIAGLQWKHHFGSSVSVTLNDSSPHNTAEMQNHVRLNGMVTVDEFSSSVSDREVQVTCQDANVILHQRQFSFVYVTLCVVLLLCCPVTRHVVSVLQNVCLPGTWLTCDDCCLVNDARPRRLRSADTRTLLVSRTRTNFRESLQCRWASSQELRNYLLTDLRQPDLSCSRFRQSLKTFLFAHLGQSAV